MIKKKLRILIVDDEPAITSGLASFLRRAGHKVAIANNGEVALRSVATFAPHLIVLDVIMPKLDGREVCRQLRQAGNWTPIIMLTQIDEVQERIMSLNEGADDYLSKPFEPGELLARIWAVLRRARSDAPPLNTASRLACGSFVLDRTRHQVLLGEHELHLTPRAIILLDYLMAHSGELLSRERLLDAVWGWSDASTRAVDIRISELRRMLKDDWSEPRYIKTVPGQGYIFVGEVEAIP